MPSIVEANMLFDKQINLAFYEGTEVTCIIKNPSTGLKPKITFEWKRVPGQFTYNCKLSVTNFFAGKTLDIMNFTAVRITAGYSTSTKVKETTIHCNIFAAYKSSGGPDSPTVFEGIVANAEASLVDNQPCRFECYAQDTTILQACSKTCKTLGFTLVTNMDSTALKDFSTSKILNGASELVHTTDTGYQMLRWLADKVGEYAKTYNNSSLVFCIYDTYAVFMLRDSKGNAYPTGELELGASMKIPVLDQTTDVTFTAGTISVVAPWNPEIVPGSIFYCNPSLFTGGIQLPNLLKDSYRDPQHCYMVIQQECKFSNVGNTNQMKILGVPLSQSGKESLADIQSAASKKNEEAKKYAEAFKDVVVESLKKAEKQEKKIPFGSKQAEKISSAFEQGWFPSSSVNYQIQRWTVDRPESLSYIAAHEFKGTEFKGYTKDGVLLKYPKEYLGYPLIALATYTYYNRNKDTNKLFQLLPSAPDEIREGYYLIIPSMTDYKSLQGDATIAKLFDEIADYYVTSKKNLLSWAEPSRNIASIVKEGKII